MPKISPKLAAAVGPPLTAVVTAMILTNSIDRTSLAALAAIAIGAALGYHAPSGVTGTIAQGELSRGLALHTTGTADTTPIWTPSLSTLDDPALDDPAHDDDEPEIPDSALTGRHAGSVKQRDHVNLGDPA